MSFSKKFGIIALVSLCITTALLIYKTGFQDRELFCEGYDMPELSHLRNLITKDQRDKFCSAIEIKNLAGPDVQNAINFLTNQTNTLINSTAGQFFGLSDDPASVVIIIYLFVIELGTAHRCYKKCYERNFRSRTDKDICFKKSRSIYHFLCILCPINYRYLSLLISL